MSALQDVMVAAVASVPKGADVLELMRAALDAAGDFFGEGPELARRRRRIIAATPELQERELNKLAGLAGALAHEFRSRGLAYSTALLSAELLSPSCASR